VWVDFFAEKVVRLEDFVDKKGRTGKCVLEWSLVVLGCGVPDLEIRCDVNGVAFGGVESEGAVGVPGGADCAVGDGLDYEK